MPPIAKPRASLVLPADVALLGDPGLVSGSGSCPCRSASCRLSGEKAASLSLPPQAELPLATARPPPRRETHGPVSTSGPTSDPRCSVPISLLLPLEFSAVKHPAADKRNEGHLSSQCFSLSGRVLSFLGNSSQRTGHSFTAAVCLKKTPCRLKGPRQLPATAGRQAYL